MVNLSVMPLSDKVRMMIKPANEKVIRLLTLEDVSLFGELNGDDYEYEGGACEYYLRSKLGFERRVDSVSRDVTMVNVVLDINNGVVSVHYDVDKISYYFVGHGVKYEEVPV